MTLCPQHGGGVGTISRVAVRNAVQIGLVHDVAVSVVVCVQPTTVVHRECCPRTAGPSLRSGYEIRTQN